ncbi:MAG: type II toxin-antitoxin system RelE/ParE family toxin [Burkholderiales bacterium]|nr:type II toxin-antitoxin system RelE/ParE family toxin [Burkholderiales bacterium]
MHTLVELPEYRKQAERLFTEEERADLLTHLAEHPKAGALIPGTGGVRKLRWGRGSAGKSGGARVIYYYHSERIPLFLLTAYGKNDQANLSKAERNELAQLVDILADYAHGE